MATAYRLTEHEHYVTQHVGTWSGSSRRRSSRFPTELAAEKGIETGDHVRGRSKRGKLEVRAVVTKRLGAVQSAARRSTRSASRSTGASSASPTAPTKGANWLANALTPFVGDASSRTPEFKAFLVNIEKM